MLEIKMQGVDSGSESQTRAWWRTPQASYHCHSAQSSPGSRHKHVMMEENLSAVWTRGNILIFRREIPHISFPTLKGGQSSAICKQHQAQFGFYMDKCKYRRSMDSKALKKQNKKIPQTSHTTCCRMPAFYTCRTLIHLQQHVKLKPSI